LSGEYTDKQTADAHKFLGQYHGRNMGGLDNVILYRNENDNDNDLTQEEEDEDEEMESNCGAL